MKFIKGARQAAATFAARQRNRAQRAKTAAICAAFMVAASPAFADLPSVGAPPGTTGSGDLIGIIKGYAKMGLALLAAVVGTMMLIQVVGGAMVRWKHYTDGKLMLADVKEYFMGSVVMLAFSITLLTLAIGVIV